MTERGTSGAGNFASTERAVPLEVEGARGRNRALVLWDGH